jgi:hypothetical protein
VSLGLSGWMVAKERFAGAALIILGLREAA